jgi:hypothetical protein
MAHSKQILDELKSLSELVANLPSESPYQMPLRYFNNLPEILMSRVNRIEQDEANFLLNRLKQDTPYKIPVNYLDELPGVILKKVTLEASYDQEPEILSPSLLQLKKACTFEVPAEYFKEFPLTLLKCIELEEKAFEKDKLEIFSPLLREMKKTVPFKLPEGYFEQFPSDIIEGVNAVDYVNQELESHSPIMNDLKIQNGYKVPDGYFDNLGDNLLSTVKSPRKASVIPFNFNKKMLRYGVAALVAGLMSIAAWTFYHDKPVLHAGNELADMKKISNDEIINYLESTPVTSVENVSTASIIIKEDDVKELFNDVSDEELQQYLEQHTIIKNLTIN